MLKPVNSPGRGGGATANRSSGGSKPAKSPVASGVPRRRSRPASSALKRFGGLNAQQNYALSRLSLCGVAQRRGRSGSRLGGYLQQRWRRSGSRGHRRRIANNTACGNANASSVATNSAYGFQATSNGLATNSAYGFQATSNGLNSANTATGANANASGDDSSNSAYGSAASAVGNNSQNTASGNNASAVGTGSNNTATGTLANAAGDGSTNVATGLSANASGANAPTPRPAPAPMRAATEPAAL
jgi:hypothetical protein